LGESEGRENEDRDAVAGAVPESVRTLHEPGRDTTYTELGDELPLLRSRRESAGALDLAASLDEPEQLIRHLIVAAQEHIGFSENEAKWKVVLGHAAAAAKELEKLNQPGARRPVASGA
jgi:hypothetical protein